MQEAENGKTAPSDLIPSLHQCLRHIGRHRHPHVAGPEGIRRRASVALVIRIQPAYSHWPPKGSSDLTTIDSFFSQDWVQHGEPQTLFIKRAVRKGDRWTSHVALPGGKRELDLEDDKQAAIRETYEEVGLELDRDAMYVGNLPQRLVTTQWGSVPLMVLCPFVFLLVNPNPLMRLQPAEVASAHWVQIRDLLDPAYRTFWHEDVSNRLAKQETGVKRLILKAAVGNMIFGAIKLLPMESMNSSQSPNTEKPSTKSIAIIYLQHIFGTYSAKQSSPLLLWGLTLGVLTDFLHLLPPYTARDLWTYPTFTQWDVRLAIWAMTRSLRRKDAQESNRVPTRYPLDSQGDVEAEPEIVHVEDLTSITTRLDGYYPLVRRAVALTMLSRVALFAGAAFWVYNRSRRA